MFSDIISDYNMDYSSRELDFSTVPQNFHAWNLYPRDNLQSPTGSLAVPKHTTYTPSSSGEEQTTNNDAGLNGINQPFPVYSKATLVSRPKLPNVDKVKAELSGVGFSGLGRESMTKDAYHKLGLTLNTKASDELITELIATRIKDQPTRKYEWVDSLSSIAHHRGSQYLQGYLAHVCLATAALQPEQEGDAKDEDAGPSGRRQQQVRDAAQDVQWLINKGGQIDTPNQSDASKHANGSIREEETIILNGFKFIRVSEKATQEEQHDPVVMTAENGDITASTEEETESYHRFEGIDEVPRQVSESPGHIQCKTYCNHNCVDQGCDLGAIPEKPMPYGCFGTKLIKVMVVDHDHSHKPYHVFNVHHEIMDDMLANTDLREDMNHSGVLTLEDVDAYAFQQVLGCLYAEASGTVMASNLFQTQELDFGLTPHLYAIVSKFDVPGLRPSILEIFTRGHCFSEFLTVSKEVYSIGAADLEFQTMFKKNVNSWLAEPSAWQKSHACTSSGWAGRCYPDAKHILKQAMDSPAFLQEFYEAMLDREYGSAKAKINATTDEAQEYFEKASTNAENEAPQSWDLPEAPPPPPSQVGHLYHNEQDDTDRDCSHKENANLNFSDGRTILFSGIHTNRTTDFIREWLSIYGEITNVSMLESIWVYPGAAKAFHVQFSDEYTAECLLESSGRRPFRLDGFELSVLAADPTDFNQWKLVQGQATLSPTSSCTSKKSDIVAVAVTASTTADCSLEFWSGDRLTNVVCLQYRMREHH